LQTKLNAVKRRGGGAIRNYPSPETTLTMGADYSTSSYIRDDNDDDDDDDDAVVVVAVVDCCCFSSLRVADYTLI
jgi:hypothetical protein